MMVSSIRSISTALPRISMARIPLVAFTNTHVSPAFTASQTQSHAHATSAHPSAYSSMPSSRNSNSNKYTNAADKLEKSAKGLSEAAKEYIREVKQYDSEEDEVLMELGLAMSTKSIKHSNGANKNNNMHTGNQSGGRRALIHDIKTEGNTFMESLSSDIQAEVTHPAGKAFHHADQHHQQEFISSLCEELKVNGRNISDTNECFTL
jgi:hypothetical protein